MLHLGPRLTQILDEVRGPVLWDLGADHGHLGLAALERGLVEEVVLVDKSVRAAEALDARLVEVATVEQRGRITVIQADAALLPACPLTGTVVVAGLGARSIVRIVERFVLPNVAGPLRLVLQPEVEAPRLDVLGVAFTCSSVEDHGRNHAILVADLAPRGHSD